MVSPFNDAEGSDPDFPVFLDLGPEPSLSEGMSRSKVRSSSEHLALVAQGARAVAARLPGRWLWGLSALIAMIVAVVVCLAVINTFRNKSTLRPTPRPSSPLASEAETDASRAVPNAEQGIFILAEGNREIPANDLSDAIQRTMRSGDPIELRSRKPLPQPSEKNLDFLGPGDIIIRATPGIEPVIEYEMTIKNPKPLLAVGSGVQLKLCGITIVVHYPEGNTPAWPPVIKAAGVAKINHCTFKVAATSHIKGSVAAFLRRRRARG